MLLKNSKLILSNTHFLLKVGYLLPFYLILLLKKPEYTLYNVDLAHKCRIKLFIDKTGPDDLVAIMLFLFFNASF